MSERRLVPSGDRCVILCTGPSICELPLMKIDCDVIGVNMSYLARQADIQVFTFGDTIERMGEELVRATPTAAYRFSGLPLTGCYTPRMFAKYCCPQRREKMRIPRLPDNYNIFDHGWIFSGGGPCALQVAVSFGYKEIIFCGLDLNMQHGQHFYSTGGPREPRGAYTTQVKFLKQFKPEFDKRGFEVYNTSLDSAEDVFEKREFNSLW